ncbi:MAG: sigma-54-dependent transcriptional regulator, partial [Longimicrobiales bacterium]
MPTNRLAVLVVDDEPALREVLSMRIEGWGYSVTTAADVTEAEAAIERRRPDLILSDVVLPGDSGIDLLKRLKRYDEQLPIIMITAHANVDSAVEAMKVGATDFLTKPLDYVTLRALLNATSEDLRQRRANRVLDARLDDGAGPGGLVGLSRPMRELYGLVELLASSDASGIITGESGTG